MGRRNRGKTTNIDNFKTSAYYNDATFMSYYRRLLELSISMFEWQNVPDTIDTRFLESSLFENGNVVFFKDEVMGYLALRGMLGGQLDVYNIPKDRTAVANNGYQRKCTDMDSVIIWNNMLMSPSFNDIFYYSLRLYEIDRTIDINVKAQKTPVLIRCDENERLTLLNLYKEYDGNAPVIFGDSSLRLDSLTVLSTNAPYLAGDLYQLKTNIWNEALTYLGIPNVNVNKKERMITDEVTRGLGGTMASRFSRLHARQQACEHINSMFGLDIWCEFREDNANGGEREDEQVHNGIEILSGDVSE